MGRGGRRRLISLALVASLAVAPVACGGGGGDEAAAPTTTAPDAPDGSVGCEVPRAERAATGKDLTLTFDDEPRTYNVTVPPDAGDDPLPLVVNMHGSMVTKDLHDEISRLPAIGREEGFVTVSPQALRPTWILEPDGPDVGFVLELIDEIEATQCIDRDRVFATGFSFGGTMALLLACNDPGRLAAIAPVAGMIPAIGCPPPDHVALLAIHGTDDPTVGIDGTLADTVAFIVGSPESRPVADQVADWAETNDCGTNPTASRAAENVMVSTYDCPDGAATELYVVEGGAHRWPDAENPTNADDPESRTIDAGEVVWEFFSQQ